MSHRIFFVHDSITANTGPSAHLQKGLNLCKQERNRRSQLFYLAMVFFKSFSARCHAFSAFNLVTMLRIHRSCACHANISVSVALAADELPDSSIS